MSTSVTASRRARTLARPVRRGALAGLSLAVASVALAATPAAAAPAAPTITGPVGTVSESPELTWTGSPGATGYEVQLSARGDFIAPEWKSATTNTVSVPLEPLAPGEQQMRVRAKDSSGWSEWSQTSFTVGAVEGPALESPTDGAELSQPDEPPLLEWTPVPGAKNYTVEIDDERDFVGARSYTTTSTSLVVPDNQSPQVTYHWRVRATLGTNIFTDVSATRTYTVFALPAPKVVGPSNDDDVTDVVLDWEPVPGAKHYELQVDDDHDFSSPEKGVPTTILGTKFSPRTTFGNDQYYWRVRAVDADNHPSPWTDLPDGDHHEFDRVWRDIPTPVHPASPSRAVATVDGDFYYEWTPVRNASRYEVWLSTDPNFTTPSPETKVCTVLGTTYATGDWPDNCRPKGEGGLYYWKVRALDLPYAGGVEGIFSEAQPFVYRDRSAFTILSPAAGAAVTVPTITWEPVESTNLYRVEIIDTDNKVVDSATTPSTSFTPPELPTEDGNNFRVRLTALDAAGGVSVQATRAFSLVAASDAPSDVEPLTPVRRAPSTDAPRLSWEPLPDADHYRVHVGTMTKGPLVTTRWDFPAATDTSSTLLAEGTYTWWVTAHDEDGLVIGTGPTAQAEVLALPAVGGQRLALTGSALDDGDVCAKSLVEDPRNWCDSVPTTPVLDWTGVPYASHYRVYVSRDGDFTTGLLGDPVSTVNTRWTPRTGYAKGAFADSQASTAYYWFVQPCKADGRCGPDPRSTIDASTHAFRKASPKVELTSPAAGATVGTTEVTFEWSDYLATNRRAVYSETGEASTQSAQTYTIEVATEPTFAKALDAATVDQTTYTATDRIYPEGPLYWRVQANDGAGNKLGWSEPRTFTKLSPTVPLIGPAGGAEVTGSVPFTWEAQPFAGSYQLQVAANEDANFSPANLVLSTQSSRRPAWTTGLGKAYALPPATSPYLWRVRQVDAHGNEGRWSEPEKFVVLPQHPELVSPGVDATVGPRALTLRWKTVAGAARHRVLHRRLGATAQTATTTYARTFAPTDLTVGTSYEWRVETLDTNNKVLGDSGWRTFTVGGPPTATVAAKVEGTGLLGTELTVTAPTWTRDGVENTYQWRRSGVPIPDATGTTYEVTVADVGRQLSVHVTGTSAEFGTGTSTSNAVTALPGAGPIVASAPTVAGSGAVGTTLVSTPATWGRDDVEVTHQWLRDGTPIVGATGETYAVVPQDLHASLALRVTGTVLGLEPTEVLSNAVTVAPGTAPEATTPPTVTGTPKVGQSLGVTAPTWDLTGVSVQRQWLRDGEAIAGATGLTYAPQPDDVDHEVSVRVTGNKYGHASAQVTSSPVVVQEGDAPTAKALPVVTGTPKVGSTLHTSVPAWSLTQTTTAVQWMRDGRAIPGATTTTYALVADDLDRTLSVRVTAARPGHALGVTESNGVSVTLGDPATTRSAATLTGIPKVGQTLTVTSPTWSRADVTTTWQWLRDGEPIAGARGATYALGAADVGARVTVRFTGEVPGHRSATAVSPGVTVQLGDAPTAPRPEAPSGTAEVGGTLTAPVLTWSLPGVAQTRQWLRDGQPIADATAETYVVTADDAGRSLSVLTTATVAGHAPGTATSGAVSVPKPTPPVVTPTPKPTPVASRTTITVPAKVRSRTAKTRVKVTIKVTATGVTPTGTVTVKVGKRVVGKATLKNGKVVLKLKPLPRGRHTLKVTYGGSATVKSSTAKKKVHIVRR